MGLYEPVACQTTGRSSGRARIARGNVTAKVTAAFGNARTNWIVVFNDCCELLNPQTDNHCILFMTTPGESQGCASLSNSG